MENSKKNAQLDLDIWGEINPIEQHNKQINRYAKGKERTEKICDYIEAENEKTGNTEKWLEKEYASLRNCGSWLLFRDYYTLHEKPKMIAGCTCKKHLLCGLCAIRRTGKALAVYLEKINVVLSSSQSPLETLFITFTIKNGSDLEERIEHLIVSMKKILTKRRDALKKNPKTDTVMKVITSAVYTYEVTYNDKTKEFHPHVHMVALFPKGSLEFSEKIETDKKTGKQKSCFVPVDFRLSLIEDWKKITGDSWNIDVRQVDQVERVEGEKNSLTRAIVETFKYAIKLGENTIAIQIAMYEALKGRRLIGSFGAMRGVEIPKNLNDKPLDDSELPYLDMLYQYCGSDIGYQITDTGQFDISKDQDGILEFKNRIKASKAAGSPKGRYTKSVEKREKWKKEVDAFADRKKTQIDDCLELIHDYYNEREGNYEYR